MIKEYNLDKYLLICDSCGEDVFFESWDEVWDFIKENGWKEDEGQDFCKSCKKALFWKPRIIK